MTEDFYEVGKARRTKDEHVIAITLSVEEAAKLFEG